MAIKLSNVIGAPFSDDVLRQIAIRARRNSTLSRSGEDVLFLANKTAWARLTSSVNIVTLTENDRTSFFSRLNLSPGEYPTPDSLARNWILEAGTSIQNGNGITIRQGIGANGAYGLGGTDELGYRPMPGLVSVQIETTGRLGSLRQATINFKVWNMNQLNIIEALYFRLGYSMLLEWGHTQYFSNKDSNNNDIPGGIFVSNGIYGIDNPFSSGRTKEIIQQDIARKVRKTSGNYDGMLGIVSNFNWSFNQEGGYDCNIRLIGLGAIMDSLRINQAYTLPEGTIKKFKENQSALERLAQSNLAAQTQAEAGGTEQFNLEPLPKNPAELFALVAKYKGPQNLTYQQFIQDYLAIGIDNFQTGKYFDTQYVIFDQSRTNQDLQTLEAVNQKFGGLWVPRGNVYYNLNPATSTSVTLNVKSKNGSSITSFVDEYFRLNPNQLTEAYKEGAVSYESLALYFQYTTRRYVLSSGQEQSVRLEDILVSTEVSNVGAVDTVKNQGDSKLKYSVRLGAPANRDKEIYFNLQGVVDSPDENRPVTRKLAIEALDKWITSDGTAIVSEVEAPQSELVKIKGSFQTPVTVQNTTKIINWYFETNNPGFILSSAEAQTPQPVITQVTQEANTGDNNGQLNQPDTQQIDSAESFQSALHAMLAIVQVESQIEAKNESLNKPVIRVDITEITNDFYKGGIFEKVLLTTSSNQIQSNQFDITQYALRGFNSDFIAYPDDKINNGTSAQSTIAANVPVVNFADLCKAYVVRYPKVRPDGSLDTVHIPVYITFGYLLAFLNNMCLIYDSKQKTDSLQESVGTEKRPYVYLDFNPETNFCLSSPQQLTVDPYTCLIPFNSTSTEYRELFAEGIKTDNFFNPENQNRVSAALNNFGLSYKSITNVYQGKIMNVLLNIDYLLGLIKQYAGADKEHAVNLQPFLERITVDINKSLGNINSLRVAYRDDANTIQIIDDQWVPNLDEEKSLIDRPKYLDSLNQSKDPILSGQLPVFEAPSLGLDQPNGTFSIAREFQFKTTLSTKLASTIAISAQAATGSVNATDHSSYSWLNKNYQDRYKPYVQDPPNKNKGTNSNTAGNVGNVNETSNDQKAADTFNTHVASIYSNLQLTEERIDMAKNYYIERMSKVKSTSSTTTAAPFIPADLEITIDGISGIIMTNAFTIPESRLPLSLRAEDGYTKVGFIITGLSHTVENNQWLTRIKGQMIKLREDSLLRNRIFTFNRNQSEFAPPAGTAASTTITNTPWSAAFISYVMRQAGVSFPSNASHAGYAQSLRTNSRGFEILDPARTQVKVGDIVVKNRRNTQGVSNTLTFNTNPWDGATHGDIVVSVNNNIIAAIGGNVSSTVFKSNIPLTNGLLATGTSAAPNFFVILRPPASFVQAIVDVANREYELWTSQRWVESTVAAIPTLRLYYNTVNIFI